MQNFGADKESVDVVRDIPNADPAAVQAKLAASNVFHIANRAGPDGVTTMAYYAAKGPEPGAHPNGTTYLAEITLKAGFAAAKICVKTAAGSDASKTAVAGIAAILKA